MALPLLLIFSAKNQSPSFRVTATILTILLTGLAPISSFSKEYATRLQNPYTFEALQNADNFSIPSGALFGVAGKMVIIAGGMTQGSKPTSIIHTFDLSSTSSDLDPLEIYLPNALAFGGSATYEESLVLVGGLDTQSEPTSTVWKIEFGEKNWSVESLSGLPEPISHAGALAHNNTLYVTGGKGATKNVIWSLDLTPTGSGQWKSNEVPIGSSLKNPSLVVQDDGSGDRLYLIGNSETGDGERASIFAYDPSSHEFSQKTSALTRLKKIGAIPVGVGHIFAFAENGSPASQPTLLAYSTVTDTWVETTSPNLSGKPLALLRSDNTIVSVVETAEGSTQVVVGKPPAFKKSMHAVDFGILALYFGLLIWMGYFFPEKRRLPMISSGEESVSQAGQLFLRRPSSRD